MCLSGCNSNSGSTGSSSSGSAAAAGGAAAASGGATVTSPSQPCAGCAIAASGGTVAHSDSVVEVSHGVAVSRGGNVLARDTIQIKANCANNPHILQFVSREIIESNGTHKTGSLPTNTGQMTLQPNSSTYHWLTDSAAKPVPYYEAAGAKCNCPGELFVWDEPTLLPTSGQTWRANFRAFVICNGSVVREVRWSRTQVDGSAATYSSSVHNTTSLPSWATTTMASDGYTYP